MSKPPPYVRLHREQPALVDAYERFASTAHEAGPLSERERRLVKLAMAVACGLEGATHSHTRQALEAGVGAADLRHVAFLAGSTVGFPSMMRALTWIDDIVESGPA
jgi:4-carboxymuconolactone decarboxylase